MYWCVLYIIMYPSYGIIMLLSTIHRFDGKEYQETLYYTLTARSLYQGYYGHKVRKFDKLSSGCPPSTRSNWEVFRLSNTCSIKVETQLVTKQCTSIALSLAIKKSICKV